MSAIKPFGLGSGVWGLALSTVLFIVVSLLTKAPTEKATEFIDYVNSELKQKLSPNKP